jgi:cytochrome c-type biogenesis protein CcmF
VFLVVIMLTVLMGTVYPLLVEGLGLGKLSVGAPYFNAVFIPLMIPMLLLMGIGIHLKWNSDSWRVLVNKLWGIALLSIVLPVILLLLTHSHFDTSALIGLILATWIILSTAQSAYKRIKERGINRVGQAYWGMVLAHLGVAATVIGIAVSTTYGVQDDVQMLPGGKIDLVGYSIEFIQQKPLVGPNYKGTQAQFKISHQGKTKLIYPEKRLYNIGQMAMTESAIDVTPFRDIYVALGEPLSGDSWSVRLYYKPLVRWIWGGGFMILPGGFLALTDRRYYQRKRVSGELKA